MKKIIYLLLLLTTSMFIGCEMETTARTNLFDTKTETIREEVEPISLQATADPEIFVAKVAYDTDGDGIKESIKEVEVSKNQITTNAAGKTIIPIITTHITLTPKPIVNTGKQLIGLIPGVGPVAEGVVGLVLAATSIFLGRRVNSGKKRISNLETAAQVLVAGVEAATTDGSIKKEIAKRAKEAGVSDEINRFIKVIKNVRV